MRSNSLQPFIRSCRSYLVIPLCVLASLLVFTAPVFAQIEADDDDDFIILDDRGEGIEMEEDDVPLSGRKPRQPRGDSPSSSSQAGGSEIDKKSENGEPVPEVAPPKRFEPTERVSEDLSVSFPADI